MAARADARRPVVPRPRWLVVAAVVLVAILAAQLSVSVVAAVSAGRDSTAATRQLFSVVADVTVERIGQFTQAAEDAVEETIATVRRGEVLASSEEVAAELFDRMQHRPELGALKVSIPGGAYFELRRSLTGYVFYVMEPGPPDRVTAQAYDAAFVPTIETVSGTFAPFDPTERPWYVEGLAADGVGWTDPYVRAATGTLAVSAVGAARAEGEVVAVVGGDLLLDQMADVLDGLPVGRDGEAFVFDAAGLIIAAPGSYASTINAYSRETGQVPTMAALGFGSMLDQPVAASSGTFGGDGDYLVMRETFPSEVQPAWTLELRATRTGIAPGVTGVQRTVLWTSALTVAFVLILVLLLWRVWRPIRWMHARAESDELTGLSNRHRFFSVGDAMVRSAHEDDNRVCVVTFDLDEFKGVNDALGHEAGDGVLVAAAEALVAQTRERDLTARIGGDEFVVVRRLRSGAEGASAFAERVRVRVASAVRRAVPNEVPIGVTVGYAVSDGTETTIAEVLRNADLAMTGGKRSGKGRTHSGEIPIRR